MKRFAALYAELDATTSTNDKLAAMRQYFDDTAKAHPQDAAWALYFLAGGKPRQVLKTAQLKAFAQEAAGLSEWLFEECYAAVGDLAETIANVVPYQPMQEAHRVRPELVEGCTSHPSTSSGRTEESADLADWVERLQGLKMQDEAVQKIQVTRWLKTLPRLERFLLVKLIGGGFRVGVSKLLVTRALALSAGVDAKIIAQRMMGYTEARGLSTQVITTKFIANYAINTAASGIFGTEIGQPYPFFLAHQLPSNWSVSAEQLQAQLGDVSEWQAEWKYDGIRAQIVKRAGQVHIWSRGEELMNGRFPEIETLALQLPDGTVLDGEVLVFKEGKPAPFALLQQRISRKTLTKKVLADAPVSFLVYDVLEWQAKDIRYQKQSERVSILCGNSLISSLFTISEPVQASAWQDLMAQCKSSRSRGVEGLMLKKLDSAYGQGRTKADGLWYKWKIDPMTVDCVLIYAQAGHGRRASLYTDYTFAVWSRPPKDAAEVQAVIDAIEKREPAQPGALQLVAFAKAYSGLTDEEFKRIDSIIRKTTLEKFGPVRSVKPSLVFELGFEGINASPRHKSGIAVRFPRMLRIRGDKPIHEANSLQDLQMLLNM